jgi:hypothetical protein
MEWGDSPVLLGAFIIRSSLLAALVVTRIIF